MPKASDSCAARCGSRGPAWRTRARLIPEEVPVALVYDGSTHAVMMATPADLEDFAVGFSLTEGVIASRAEIRELEIVEHDKGIEARMWLVPASGRTHAERRRRIAGPTACGLCGVESLEAAVPRRRSVWATRRHGDARRNPRGARRPAAGADAQRRDARRPRRGVLGSAAGSIAMVREDVGRHNALDKLVGAMRGPGSIRRAGSSC